MVPAFPITPRDTLDSQGNRLHFLSPSRKACYDIGRKQQLAVVFSGDPSPPHAPTAELVVEACLPRVRFPGKRSSESSTSLDAHRTVGGAPPRQLKNIEGKPSELKERQSDGEDTHLYCLLDMVLRVPRRLHTDPMGESQDRADYPGTHTRSQVTYGVEVTDAGQRSHRPPGNDHRPMAATASFPHVVSTISEKGIWPSEIPH